MLEPKSTFGTVMMLFFFVAANAGAGSFYKPRSLAYILQAELLAPTRQATLSRLAQSGRDLIVIDPFYSRGVNGRWQPAEIDQLHQGRPGRKVIAYLSIGEAESYRSYWQARWRAPPRDGSGSGTPEFLLPENPDWPGNYKVKFWEHHWQAIILAEVVRIIQQGFDGLYLDIVDAFEYFEFDPAQKKWHDDRDNPATGRSFRADMVAWVETIALFARNLTGDRFLIIPQNGTQLLAYKNYRDTIQAIGVEDLFTLDNNRQSEDHIRYVLGFLRKLTDDGKPVFVIEYADRKRFQTYARQQTAAHRFTLLLTDRSLATLGHSN